MMQDEQLSKKLNAYQIQNEILTSKVLTLTNLCTEYSTKYKEIELRLQCEYNQLEEQYIDTIQNLKYQIKNQQIKLDAMKNEIFNKSQHDNENIMLENMKHKQQNKSLQNTINEQNKQFNQLKNSKNEQLETLKLEIKQQDEYIAELKHKLETKYESFQPIRRDSTPSTVKVQEKSTSTPSKSKSLHSSTIAGDTKFYFEIKNVVSDALFENYEIDSESDNESDHNDSKQLQHKHEQISEWRTNGGKLVIKQLSYSQKTHICINLFVEISPTKIEHIVLYFERYYTVEQVLNLLDLSNIMNDMFGEWEMDIYRGNEDGELDENRLSLELGLDQIIGNLGLINFYGKMLKSSKHKSLSINIQVDNGSTNKYICCNVL